MVNIEYKAYIKNYYNFINVIVDVKSIHLGTNKIVVGIKGGGNSVISFKHIELLQYIGLKDKNDKKIFEGHIIKCVQNILVIPVEASKISSKKEELILEVYWCEGECAFRFADYKNEQSYSLDELCFNSSTIEIIGHKFINPDLLEDK